MYLPYKNKKNSENGFTLIEIICALILLGLIGTYFFVGYMNIARTHIEADANYQQTQKTQSALLRMILEMQGASGVSVVNNVITYTPNSSSTTRTISKSGTNLVLHRDSDNTNHILVDNVSEFTITYSNSTAYFTITTNTTGDAVKNFSTSAYISN